MKTLIAALLTLSATGAFAVDKSIALTQGEMRNMGNYVVGVQDCQGLALIAKGTAVARDEGVSQQLVINSLLKPEDMANPGYRAMLPTALLVVADVYKGPHLTPQEHAAHAKTGCSKRMVGMTMPYFNDVQMPVVVSMPDVTPVR